MKKLFCAIFCILLLTAGCRKKDPEVVFYLVEEDETTTMETTLQTTDGTEETTEEANEDVVVENKVANNVRVEERTETIVNITTKKITAAPPPETVITQRANENNSGAKRIESMLNSKRSEAGAGALQTDSSLTKEAQYHSDCFARDKTTYSIDGHKASISGKVSKVETLGSKSFNTYFDSNGLFDKDISKVGVGVSQSDSGGYYYVILAK